MLISHRRRFIFTKTVKTGSTSIESYFEPECLPPGQWTSSHFREESVTDAGVIGYRGTEPPTRFRWWNHMPARQIREQIGERIWEEYFKFTVVRNPYEKAVSAFYFLAERDSQDFVLAREQERFQNWLLTHPLPADRDKYMIDGEVVLDRLMRYESLHSELAEVCSRLGVPWRPERLPKFKAGVRPTEASAATIYTSESKRLVQEAYAWELEHLGYSFPT